MTPSVVARSAASRPRRTGALEDVRPGEQTRSGGGSQERRRPVLDVVVPVLDEQDDLGPCVERLHAHLSTELPYPFRITIADNASSDATPAVAAGLAATFPEVTVVRLDQKGRGRALHAVWSASDADVLVYTDVDLSTDLAALLPLVAPLVSGHSDLAIGTRLTRSSRVVRGAKREFISRSYNLLLRGMLHARFSDAQCGFKAIRRDVALRLLPMVQDTGWFFDTELLVLAERSGLRIHEVPVDWVDDPDSRVDIVPTALADLRGVARVARALSSGSLPVKEVRAELGRGPVVPGVPRGLAVQVLRFGAVGLASTLAYVLLFVTTRGSLGAQGANALALVVTAVANTAVNRRVTFGVRGRRDAGRHQLQGLLVFAVGLVLTSGSLALLHVVTATTPASVELGVLVGANLLATVTRFLLLRRWVFGPPAGVPAPDPAPAPVAAPAAGPVPGLAPAPGGDVAAPSTPVPSTPTPIGLGPTPDRRTS